MMTSCSLCLMAQEAGKVHLKGRIVDENEDERNTLKL